MFISFYYNFKYNEECVKLVIPLVGLKKTEFIFQFKISKIYNNIT